MRNRRTAARMSLKWSGHRIKTEGTAKLQNEACKVNI